MTERKPLGYLPVVYSDFHVTINGREYRWLSRIVGIILTPFIRWHSRRRRRN